MCDSINPLPSLNPLGEVGSLRWLCGNVQGTEADGVKDSSNFSLISRLLTVPSPISTQALGSLSGDYTQLGKAVGADPP